MLLELLVSGIAGAVVGGIAGAVVGGAVAGFNKWVLNRRITELEASYEDLVYKVRSAYGVKARQNRSAEQTAAMAEIAAALKEGKDIKTLIPSLLAKYPNLAKSFLKDFKI